MFASEKSQHTPESSADLRTELEQKENRIEALEKVIEQKQEKIESQKSTLKEKRIEVRQKDAHITVVEGQMEALDSELLASQTEVEKIAEIQQALLPSTPPVVPNLQIASSHIAPSKAGGDYFDFLTMPFGKLESPQTLVVIIADVSGHGPASAVVMAMMHSLLHAYSESTVTPDELMNYLNAEMSKKSLDSSFVTSLLMNIDLQTLQVTYACAGHHPPLLRTENGRVVALNNCNRGLPLTVDSDEQYAMDSYKLQPGETLLLFTDGASEAMNPAGDQFGEQNLMKTFADSSGIPTESIADINDALKRHRNGAEQDDDKTMVAIQAV